MKDLPRDLRTSFDEIDSLYATDRSRVADAIESADFGIERFRPFLTEPAGRPYGRCLLHHTPGMEVILMNWEREGVSLPHDHGESEGWVKVLTGVSTHKVFTEGPAAPTLKETQTIEAGTVFHAKPGLVHSMANHSANSLVTLHFYFPPIHAMEVFDMALSRSAIVADDCGAWWPESTDQVVSVRPLDQPSAMKPIPEPFQIREGGLEDPQVVALVDLHIRAARAQTVEGSAHAIGPSGLSSSGVRFWSAWDGDALVGIGALKRLSPDHGEVKSMHTAIAYRRRGAGSEMLNHIIATAREMGIRRLSLETGSWDYFKPAHALYRRHGFLECEPFGDYKPDVNSLFFTLELADLE